MSGVIKSDLHFRIGHVLFLDIVGYSNLLITEQHDFVEHLNRLVRANGCFQRADESGDLVCAPAGDGMALVFSGTVEMAVECALEIARELRNHPELHVRMGIHSGPISLVHDVNERSNVAGAGINVAQRVMSRGDAGHILLSRHVAEDLEQYPRWRSCLHDLGDCEVKHGQKIGIVNFYSAEVGNPEVPSKMLLPPPGGVGRRVDGRKLALLCGGFLLAAVGVTFFLRQADQQALDKSVAILPFESLSADKENAYFATGIQDDVLTNLAKVGDLRVISRTSVMKYQGHPQSVREIGRALGVGAILEGSVRRDGNRVRVSVQLIDTETDRHIWAEDYDRELTDVFAIQSDLALQIAAALQSRLSLSEKALLQKPPTTSGEAYLDYLRGRDHALHGRLEEATDLLEQAIQLDPNFALAFAHLSYVENSRYLESGDPVQLDRAATAAHEAIRLQPNLPEAHLAMAYNFYRGSRDYASALRELAVAQAGLPNNPDVFLVKGSIERRQGKWAESIAEFQKATTISPQDPTLWANLGTSYQALGDFNQAARSFDRGIVADPTFFINHWLRAQLEIDRRGDLGPSEEMVARTATMPDPDGKITYAAWQLKLLQRRFPEALEILQRSQREWFSLWRSPTPVPRSLLLGFVCRLQNDTEGARRYFEAARQSLEHSGQENPTDASRCVLLGQAYAGLGRREEALREGARAMQLLPEAQDAVDGPDIALAMARIDIMLGETEAAVALIDHLLAVPSGLSLSRFNLDPTWDSLRAHPGVEKTLISHSQEN